ncbi:MAG TPA: hypothetical protein VHM88_02190 [Candidatus Acidoferrales bacterium]|jgi:cell shape-determining protein MreD|nr:hypothetical protein [Candidatus Acidoferrales bacterium]
MTIERYLIVSYFVCAALSVAVGTLVFFLLRRPFGGVADAVSGKHFPSTLKRLFPLGLVLPALLGFLSVSYWSCQQKTYEKIVQSRRYLVGKNQEQISSTLLSILVAVLFWDVVALLILKYAQSDRKGS